MADPTVEQCYELGMTTQALLLDLVKGLDTDLLMLAKAEHAQNSGSTEIADRATARLMKLTAIVAPNLIDTNPEA